MTATFPTIALGSVLRNCHLRRTACGSSAHILLSTIPPRGKSHGRSTQGLLCQVESSLHSAYVIANLSDKELSSFDMTSSASEPFSPEYPGSDSMFARCAERPDRASMGSRPKRTKRKSPAKCCNCGTSDTPSWRRSIKGELLCNACGLYYKVHNSPRPMPPVQSNFADNSNGRDLKCFNCQATSTPMWRRNPYNHVLCNACGLYYKLHGQNRPIQLRMRGAKIRPSKRQNIMDKRQSHTREAAAAGLLSQTLFNRIVLDDRVCNNKR